MKYFRVCFYKDCRTSIFLEEPIKEANDEYHAMLDLVLKYGERDEIICGCAAQEANHNKVDEMTLEELEELSEQIIKEYEEAYKELSKGE